MMARNLLRFALVTLCVSTAMPVLAQGETAPTPPRDGSLRVNQVTVYGDDACPVSTGDEIVVCGRMDESERYRIPEPLRGDPNNIRRESWSTRVTALERVGRTGTDSCSPVGAGGMTGCLNQIIGNAYAERDQARGTDWTNAVADARRERMDGYDAEARDVEAQITRDEEARVARERQSEASAEQQSGRDGPDATPLPNPNAPR